MTTTNTLPILIGHNDTLLNLYLHERGEGRTFFTRSDKGHIDLPRAREGGLGGGFFAIFVPPDPTTQALRRDKPIMTSTGYEMPLASAIEQSYAQQTTMAMIANLYRLEAESDGQIKVVRTIDELATCL